MGSETLTAAASTAPAYGIRCAGIGLVLPRGTAVEYLADVPIDLLPGAPSGVLGLASVRGHPRVVLDAGGRARARARGLRADVVLIGASADAGGVSVDEAPRPLSLRSLSPQGQALRPTAGPMRGALLECFVEVEAAHSRWWSFDPARLFAVLAGS